MESQKNINKVYRGSAAGVALCAAMEEMNLAPELCGAVWEQFDKSLRKKVLRKAKMHTSFSGEIATCRQLNNYYEIKLKDVKLKLNKKVKRFDTIIMKGYHHSSE